MFTVSNLGGAKIIILICSEILFFPIFTSSDFLYNLWSLANYTM
jgi:hypothetical protein